MHRNQKSQQEKMPCHGADPSQQSCMCACNQQIQAMIPQFAPKATLNVPSVLFLPAVSYQVDLFDPGSTLIPFISHPEQPPRL